MKTTKSVSKCKIQFSQQPISNMSSVSQFSGSQISEYCLSMIVYQFLNVELRLTDLLLLLCSSQTGEGDRPERKNRRTAVWHCTTDARLPLPRSLVQKQLRLPHLQVSPNKYY